MPTTVTRHHILAANADQVFRWFQERGGIAVWSSIDICTAGQSWTTPLHDAEGQPTKKQNWRMEESPSLVITDPAEVVVDVPREVKRFRVGLKMGGQGLLLKCTNAASRRIRRECAKAGEESWYEFDYGTQEAVIYAPGESLPLPEYVRARMGLSVGGRRGNRGAIMSRAIRLVKTRTGCEILETHPRYDVLLYGKKIGQLYFNMRGYTGVVLATAEQDSARNWGARHRCLSQGGRSTEQGMGSLQAAVAPTDTSLSRKGAGTDP